MGYGSIAVGFCATQDRILPCECFYKWCGVKWSAPSEISRCSVRRILSQANAFHGYSSFWATEYVYRRCVEF